MSRQAPSIKAVPWRSIYPMALLLAVTTATALAVEPALEQRTTAVRQAFEQQILPILKTYCLDCHGAVKPKVDLDFSRITTGSAALADKHHLMDGLNKLLSHEMPPPEKKQPSDAERDQVRAWLSSVRRLSPKDPGPGFLRRLSRAEYANTLRDLLGVDPAIAADLPADAVGEGFTNALSPLLMEKYLLIADETLDQHIRQEQVQYTWTGGQFTTVINGTTKTDESDHDRTAPIQLTVGMQLNTVLRIPADGTYVFRIKAAAVREDREPVRVAVRFGKQEIGELRVISDPKTPAVLTLRAKLFADKAPLNFSLIPRPPATQSNNRPSPAGAAKPAAAQTITPSSVIIETVDLRGPPVRASSEFQRRLFIAMPDKDLEKREASRRIIEAFTRQAFRRPATSREIEILLRIFDLADGQDEPFIESVKLMLKAVLISPQFLYIAADTTPVTNKVRAVGDHQIAARLSYLLWATMPDAELSALADAGTLHQPAVITVQVKRMIADPRANAFFDSFGAQWLGLNNLHDLQVDELRYPGLTPVLRQAMYDEASLFFMSILRDNRSLIDLLDADFTYLNAPLAKLYGMDAEVKGNQMQRVRLSDGNRGGVLTMPGVLAMTSNPNRTSPVKRGKWVLEQILGQHSPPPPPDIEPLERQDTPENARLNTRQRTERHREDPACIGCHRVIDTIGFGFENFDVLGRWRDTDDTGLAVIPGGELPGKISFRTPRELKRIIVGRKNEVCRTLVGKILAHTLCRSLVDYDEVVADDIAIAVTKDGYRLQTAVIQAVTSYPFLYQR
ncbi:MAG: DUF1592 domain-containing protein [Planctomycetes bacterium]|nr:DUF1592 domain-containing protein [Planctomycetota bacterium]